MNLPTKSDIDRLFDMAATPEPVRRHCLAVAELALDIATRLAAAGVPVDPEFTHSAALLHDVAKGQRRHAEAGADLLAAAGYPEVAHVVAHHMDIRSQTDRLDEKALVFLADKLVQGEARVTLKDRFGIGLNRFADKPEALAGALRRYRDARNVLAAVEDRIGPIERPLPPAHPPGER